MITICHLAIIDVCVMIIMSIGNAQISIPLLCFPCLFVELMITMNALCLNQIKRTALQMRVKSPCIPRCGTVSNARLLRSTVPPDPPHHSYLRDGVPIGVVVQPCVIKVKSDGGFHFQRPIKNDIQTPWCNTPHIKR